MSGTFVKADPTMTLFLKKLEINNIFKKVPSHNVTLLLLFQITYHFLK